MCAQNTVDCQHLKICKVDVRNTKMLLGRTKQASRGDWVEIIGIVFGSDGAGAHIMVLSAHIWSQPQGQLHIHKQLDTFLPKP